MADKKALVRGERIESFLAEPLDGIADETLRDTLKGELRTRLEALS